MRAALAVQPRLEQPRTLPAAGDRADVGQQVHGDHRQADRLDVHAELLVHELCEPEQVKPPDRIGQKLADGERPRLAERQQVEPRNLAPADRADRFRCMPTRPATVADVPAGGDRVGHQNNTHIRPARPVAMNAACQPQLQTDNRHDSRRDDRRRRSSRR